MIGSRENCRVAAFNGPWSIFFFMKNMGNRLWAIVYGEPIDHVLEFYVAFECYQVTEMSEKLVRY